jgi:hypothetical protein
MTQLRLRVMEGELAVWRMPPEAPLPSLQDGPVQSITRTPHELSIVSAVSEVAEGAVVERGWRCMEVEGPLPFEMTGVLASLSAPLAAAGVPIFVVSTHDTDYLLVRTWDLRQACELLAQAGHRVVAG